MAKQEPRYSICCSAYPIGETYSSNGLVFGRCRRCKEGTTFHTQQELDDMSADDVKNSRISFKTPITNEAFFST
jgi:hypothetical protein